MTKNERATEVSRLLLHAVAAEQHAREVEATDPILASSERARAMRLRRRANALKKEDAK